MIAARVLIFRNSGGRSADNDSKENRKRGLGEHHAPPVKWIL